jgi:hypothetical protein
MKKTLAAIAAGLLLSTAALANAAPLEISGTATIKYQSETADQSPSQSGMMTTLTLRGEQPIGRNLSVYVRLAAQYASNPVLADYDLGIHGADTKFVASIDQFGILFKPKNFSFNLGRQEALVGKTALLYSRSETNVGYGTFVDGLSFEGTVGQIELSGIAARENNLALANNSLYALRAGYNLSKTTNAGFTWANYRVQDGDTTNHWAIDASTTWGKSSFTGEYAQSSTSQENKAYALSVNYDFDGKTALYLTHFRVEANADMGGQSDFDNNNRGFYYGLTHAFNDKLSLEVIYKDQVLLSDDSKNSKLEIWLKNKF